MASIAIVARPSKRTDGRLPLYVRCHAGRVTRYVSLSLHVRPAEWNETAGEVRKRHARYQEVNRYLSEVRAQAEGIVVEIVTRGESLTASRIKRGIRAEFTQSTTEDEPCFLAYCAEHLSTWQGRWGYQTYLAYQTAVRKLREWHAAQGGGTRLAFDDVTPALLRRFQAHLAAPRPHGLGNRPNTQHKNLTTLAGFYRQAMEDGMVAWGRNPFDGLSLKKEQARKEKLTTAELRAFRDVTLDEDSLLAEVRRWFLFAFYAGGMRFSDVAELQRQHLEEDTPGEVRVRYRMGKTGSLHGVILVPEAVAMLDRYEWRGKARKSRVFPILDGYDTSTAKARRESISKRNALANKYLRKIARKAGIEKGVSFHLARHALAGYLLETGHDVRTIQQILGHAEVRITEQYLRGFRSSGPDDAMRGIRL